MRLEVVIGDMSSEVVLEELDEDIAVEDIAAVYDLAILEHIVEPTSGDTIVDGRDGIGSFGFNGLVGS